jgi:Family of unknown function (DUF6130)
MDRYGKVVAILALLVGLAVAPALAADVEVSIVGLQNGNVPPHPQLGQVVIVSVKPKDFELKDFTKATSVNGHEGHVHIWLDDQSFNTLTSEPVWVFGGVKPGPHTLHVELVANNHTPLSPRVKKEIKFTMGAKP